MKRQIIRLTESDLHRIIKESVKRIIRESEMPTLADLEAAKSKVRALKGKKGMQKEFIAAAKELQRIKELLGKVEVNKNPSPYWSDEENERRGVFTHDQWLRMDPRKRKDVENPNFKDIDKGRAEIAADALRREKELKAMEQGASEGGNYADKKPNGGNSDGD